ncbi:MAG TPA: glycosyltransferase family 4 protein [Candidatus Sulfotelmatobacter sp.]|nr:glycosyltransferase family 4 protein [Candidatus Sulfotelmatobacter sp.]
MKILLISGSLPAVHCGIGDYTATLARTLAAERGTSVEIMTTTTPLHDPSAVQPAAVVASVPRWGWRALGQILATVRRRRPDVVHVQYPAVGYNRALGIVFAPLAVRLLTHTPVVLTIHERRERGRLSRLAIDVMAISASRVVLLDPIEADDLRRHVPGLGERVVMAQMLSTIPVQPDVDRGAIRARLGAGADDLLIATFGLIHPRRRIEAIVDALGILQQRGVGAHLLIIGAEAEYDQAIATAYVRRLRDQVGASGKSGVVTWLGYVKPAELSAYLQASDVGVLLYPTGASRRNTTLRAAIEHALPVVTTDGPATPADLRQVPSLGFVSVDDPPEHIADAILAMRRSAPRAVTAQAHERNLRDQVDRHLALYRSLSQARPRPSDLLP